MTTYTKSYNLTKPAGEDAADIEVINRNMDILDAVISKLDTEALKTSGGVITGTLKATFAGAALVLADPASTTEGGEIALSAPEKNNTLNGISIDTAHGCFRVFGIPSLDGSSKVGVGAPLIYNPYTKKLFLADDTENEFIHTGNISSCGFAKTAYGSYVGTGTFGVNNPNSIIFDFAPKFVYITVMNAAGTRYQSLFLIRGTTGDGSVGDGSNTVLWENNTVSWYNGYTSTSNNRILDAEDQLNANGKTYCYFAIG